MVVQTDRKHFPKNILKQDKELTIGNSDFATSGEISVVKWKDRGTKSVKIASNMHDPEDFTEVQRTNKKGEKINVKCPKVIYDYNRYMGGVNHFDQLQSTYSIIQKSRKWWMKVFYFLLDSAIVNSYILYTYTMKKKNQKAMKQLYFRKKLASELIGNFSSRKKVLSSQRNKKDNTSASSLDIRIAGEHFPLPTTSRRCARCSTTDKPKRCSIECSQCKVALCIQCFAPYHQK